VSHLRGCSQDHASLSRLPSMRLTLVLTIKNTITATTFFVTTTISIAIIYHNPPEQSHDAMVHYLRLRPSRSISNTTSMPLPPLTPLWPTKGPLMTAASDATCLTIAYEYYEKHMASERSRARAAATSAGARMKGHRPQARP
jgi:hypothetical protein